MEFIRAETSHVTGLMGKSGDPSPVTAFGVYRGIKACAKYRYGSDALAGKTIAMQGVGQVGYYLAELLYNEEARLIVTDIDPARVQRVVQEFKATAVALDAIYSQQADIFAPCALGAIINDETLPQLKVQIVAGAANNVVAEERHGDEIEAKGVPYAPGYVIHGGGPINVNPQPHGRAVGRAPHKTAEVFAPH